MGKRDDRAEGLRELTPEDLAAMGMDDCEPDEEYVKAIRELKAKEDRAKELAEAQAQLRAAKMREKMQALRSQVFEDVIGMGRNSTRHPGDGLDIVVANSLEGLIEAIKANLSQEAFADGPIAFVPCHLWPLAIQPAPPKPEDGRREPAWIPPIREKSCGIVGQPYLSITDQETGQPIPNLELGRARIQASYGVVQCVVRGEVRNVSISGMARIAVNPFGGLDPADICDRLDRTARYRRWSNQSAPDVTVHQSRDGLSESDEGGAFQPSEANAGTVGRLGAEKGRAIDPSGPNNQVDDLESPPFTV